MSDVKQDDKAGLLTAEKLRAHAKSADSLAWQGQARQLLNWAADLLDAAEGVMIESSHTPSAELHNAERVTVDAEVLLDAIHIMRCPFDQCARCTEISERYAPHGAYKALEEAVRAARTRSTPSASVTTCEHEWVSARNEAVASGEVCLKCYAVRAEPTINTTTRRAKDK